MKEERLLYVFGEIDERYVEEAAPVGKAGRAGIIGRAVGKVRLLRWGAAAACLCLLCVSAITIPKILKGELPPDNGLTVIPIPDVGQTLVPDSGQTVGEKTDGEKVGGEQEIFVPISSLLAAGNNGIEVMAAAFGKVSIGQYTGRYEKVQSVESAVLSENRGRNISGTEGWYYVSGHTDMQYLIRNDNEEYSLWKFSCFDSGEYLYRDVLELVYQIDSADAISEIEVSPARMDNTDGGIAIQERIGTHTITDREEIETIYDILSSLTCYGSNHWDMIDNGSTDVPADAELPSHQAVWLGRYLSIVTNYGNEIDGLKYTAVSDMFYEFSGIAYNRLTEEQAASVWRIIGIVTDGEEDISLRDRETGETRRQEVPSGHADETFAIEATNADASLEYVTELQNKVSSAMINHELPFVISSAVYENPYRLHVVVTSDAEDDLQELKALDTAGGVLEIEYNTQNTNFLE